MQKSIEVEYWVTDRDGALTELGALADVSEYTEGEFVEPLVELNTPPCETFAGLRSTFVDQLDGVLAWADDIDKLLVPLRTPLNGEPIERLGGEHGRLQERVLGANLAYAKYCAGMHLHLEKRNVVDQPNVLIGLDTALALIRSSPYFRGEGIATEARSYLYRKKAYEHFPAHGQLWDYVDTVAQGERWLGRRFDEFRAAAVEAGVDEERIDATFSPDDVVWTPVRLRDAMPTIEWQAPDIALLSQILRLAEEVDGIVERLHHTTVRVEGSTGEVTADGITLPAFDALADYVEGAIHDGLASADVASYLRRMGFNVDGYEPISGAIDGREHVGVAEARDLRRRYGRELERDVERLRRD